MALPDRSKRVSSIPTGSSIEQRWSAQGQLVPAKMGPDVKHYVAVTEDSVEARFGAVGYRFLEDGSFIRPGPTLTFEVDYRLVDFQGQSLNVLCDKKAPTINDPYFPIVQKPLDSATEEIAAIIPALSSLAGL